MKHPEATEASSGLPPLSVFVEKIRYEYNGNYSQQIRLNPAVLRKIHEIIGVPIKSFVVKDGNETPERTSYDMLGLEQGREIKQRKPICAIKKTNNEVILIVNSQVIDGRVQDEQRRLNKGNEEISYKDIFTAYLKEILSEGVSIWAFGELDRFTPWQKFFKVKKLGKLLLENRDLLVTINGN